MLCSLAETDEFPNHENLLASNAKILSNSSLTLRNKIFLFIPLKILMIAMIICCYVGFMRFTRILREQGLIDSMIVIGPVPVHFSLKHTKRWQGMELRTK